MPLGIFWLCFGPPRPVASDDWEPQEAIAWSTNPQAVYADANGDGVVDEREVIVIGMNWGLTSSQSAPSKDHPSQNNPLNAYQMMYRFLRAQPEGESAQRLLSLLANLIESTSRPTSTKLIQNHPNPANPETWIPFTLSHEAEVSVLIYDFSGRLLRTLKIGSKESARYTTPQRAVYWDGRDEQGHEVASGIYLYQLRAGQEVFTKRMIVLK